MSPRSTLGRVDRRFPHPDPTPRNVAAHTATGADLTVIVGRNDSYLTLEELGEMIGRSPKTVRRWATEGRLKFHHLCDVPLIPMSQLERLIEGGEPYDGGDLAKKLMQPSRKRSRGKAAGKPMSATEILAMGRGRGD